MRKTGNPLVWIVRFRHRRGYGVHSPFAYHFLRDVVYETAPYYSYTELDQNLRWWQRLRIRRGLHLLLRIANYVQPSMLLLPQGTSLEAVYMKEGCPKALLGESAISQQCTMCFLKAPDDKVLSALDEDSVLVLDNLQQYRQWFRSLPAIVRFDLYDLGIAFFNPKYNRQYYIVNF